MAYDVDPRMTEAQPSHEKGGNLTDSEKSLSGSELFQDLNPDVLRDIESRCRWRRYAKNAQILSRASNSLDVYFIVAGSVRAAIYAGSEREIALANFSAGDYFGEMAAIDGKPHSADVYAMTETVLASLDHKTFIDTLHKYPQVSLRITKHLINTVRTMDVRVRDLSTLTAMQRVYAELLRLAEPSVKPDGTWGIRDMPNHREIAIWAGTTQDTVARAIGHLARDGVVERRRKTLYIKDRFRLRMLAQSVENDSVH